MVEIFFYHLILPIQFILFVFLNLYLMAAHYKPNLLNSTVLLIIAKNFDFSC